MTAEEVKKFYPSHVNEPYFLELIEFMISGPCMALVLAKVTPGETS